MKTSAIAILAVAATAFAQTNVLVGTEADFIGPTDNFQVTLGQCFDLPQRYHLALTSIAPNEGFQCDAFSGPGCSGVTQSGGPINVRVPNLGAAPWNFDNRAFSIRCARE